MNLYAVVVKIPMIISDLAIGYFIYSMLKGFGRSEDDSRLGVALYVLNPFTIIISAVWGMFDAIPTMLSLMALSTFLRKKRFMAGILMGLGILFKIYPILLIPIFIIYEKRQERLNAKNMLRFLVPTLSIPLLASIPFIAWDSRGFILSLMHHANPSGWMSYWFPLSHLFYVAKKYSAVIFILFFILLYIKILKSNSEFKVNMRLPFTMSLLVMLCFFITSPKVNSQYVVWLLPLIIIDLICYRKRFNLVIFYAMIVSVTFAVLALMPLNNYFLLNMSFSFPKPSIVNVLVAVSVAASVCFPLLCVLYFRHILKRRVWRTKGIKIVGKSGIALILSLIIIGYFAAPIPSNVEVNEASILAIPESPATGFSTLLPGYGVEEFCSKYQADGVVLAFGPDFINTYIEYGPEEEVQRFFKAYYYEKWKQKDILDLVKSLHREGVKAYLGIFTLNNYMVDSRGYISEWLEMEPEVTEDGMLIFNRYLVTEDHAEPYYAFFGEKTIMVVEDFNFDGVALLSLGVTEAPEDYLHGLTLLAEYLDRNLEGDLILSDILNKGCMGNYVELLKYSDYLILQVFPWARGVYHLDRNYWFGQALSEVENLISQIDPEDLEKVLVTVEVMDEQEGWINSAYSFRREVADFQDLNVGGYALVYANRSSPYSLS